jgi:DNA-binding IclR family transcriptional regulator
MPEPIRLDEVLAELARLERDLPDGPAGFTVRELADKLGMVVNTTQERLRRMIAAGQVEFVGKRRGLNISGGGCQVPVYRLRKPQP